MIGQVIEITYSETIILSTVHFAITMCALYFNIATAAIADNISSEDALIYGFKSVQWFSMWWTLNLSTTVVVVSNLHRLFLFYTRLFVSSVSTINLKF